MKAGFTIENHSLFFLSPDVIIVANYHAINTVGNFQAVGKYVRTPSVIGQWHVKYKN
jgi:hypothetical protein